MVIIMLKNFDLRQKKVIDVDTAEKIGYIRDMDIDIENGRINSVTIPKNGFFGFLTGKAVTVPWRDVVAVGSEFVLVKRTENLVKNSDKSANVCYNIDMKS